MLFKFYDKIIVKYANLVSTLILLAIFFFFSFVVFPALTNKSNITPLDLQYFYSADKAYNTIAQFNQEERTQYIITECTADAVYPIVYTLLLSFALFLFFNKLWLARLPLIIFLIDYLENICIIILVKRYPTELDVLANITGFLSGVKWISVLIIVIIVFIGLVNKLRKLIS